MFCMLHDILLLHVQAANIEAEASGINDGEFQLTKHEFSSLGRGKYSGTHELCSLSLLGYFVSLSGAKINFTLLNR